MRTDSGKAGKNEQVTLEIEEPERLWRGLRGLVHGEVHEVRGVQLETPGM